MGYPPGAGAGGTPIIGLKAGPRAAHVPQGHSVPGFAGSPNCRAALPLGSRAIVPIPVGAGGTLPFASGICAPRIARTSAHGFWLSNGSRTTSGRPDPGVRRNPGVGPECGFGVGGTVRMARDSNGYRAVGVRQDRDHAGRTCPCSTRLEYRAAVEDIPDQLRVRDRHGIHRQAEDLLLPCRWRRWRRRWRRGLRWRWWRRRDKLGGRWWWRRIGLRVACDAHVRQHPVLEHDARQRFRFVWHATNRGGSVPLSVSSRHSRAKPPAINGREP